MKDNDYIIIDTKIYLVPKEVRDYVKLLENTIRSLEEEEAIKEDLISLAEDLAIESEGGFSGLKCTDSGGNGVTVYVYCDQHDYSLGDNRYKYSWDELKDIYKARNK